MKETFDKSAIKKAAWGRETEILKRVAGIPSELLDGKHHACPKCGGKDRFRYDPRKGFVFCNQCLNKENGDVEAGVMWMQNVSYPEALQLIGEYLGVKPQSVSSGRKEKPSDYYSVVPQTYDATLAKMWFDAKKITEESFLAAGGALVKYMGDTLIGIPAYAPDSDFTSPVRWVLYNRLGGPVQTKQGDVASKCIKVTKDAPKGLIGLHGLKNLSDATTVFKVEGATDLLSLWDAIPLEKRNLYSIVTNANGCIENPTPEAINLLAGKEIIVIGDADYPGQNGANKWGAALVTKAKRVWNLTLPFSVDESHGKDLRDYFQEGKTFDDLMQLEKIKIETNPIQELATTQLMVSPTKGTAIIQPLPVVSDNDYWPQFMEDVSNPLPSVPTRFKQLDQILKGGLRPGLYGFGAITSLGKTTLIIQIADQIAASGRDVLIFTLEMTRNELLAKSLSRLTALFHNEDYHKLGNFLFAKTATDIMDNKQRHTQNQEYQNLEMDYFVKAVQYFQASIGPRRFIVEPAVRCDFPLMKLTIDNFCQGQERLSLAEKEGRLFLPPVILIDYFQIIPPVEGGDLRLHLSETIRSLKNLSKNLRTPVFVISSFNRSSYNSPISYESFKECGDIEYGADFLCGINPICVEGKRIIRPGYVGYDHNLAKSRKPRMVELVVLKNRYGEISGEKGILYEYFPAYNFFREISSDGFIVEDTKASAKTKASNSSTTVAIPSRRSPPQSTTNQANSNPSNNQPASSEKGNRVTSDEF